MKISSNSIDIELKEHPKAPYALKVIQLYEEKSYYKIKKEFSKILNAIREVPETIIQEAIAVYEKARDSKNPKIRPYPAYFITVVTRKYEEYLRTNELESLKAKSTNWGATI